MSHSDIIVVQLLSRVQLFVTPWTAACHTSLSFTISWSLFKLMFIEFESVMHPTISSSVISFSSFPQSFPASGSFPMSQLFTSGGQSIGASASASVLTMNVQGWFPLGLTDLIFLLFKGLRFFLVLMTLTVMSNAFVRYFVECPSVKIIPELSPPIRKGQNLLIFDSPNATTSSRRIQYFNFFFFFFEGDTKFWPSFGQST